jgi:trehalose 6-phosphate synthase/phosphatase
MHPADFVLAMGDDWTDEFLFKELPEQAHTIKVGTENSAAKDFVSNHKEVRSFLNDLVKS